MYVAVLKTLGGFKNHLKGFVISLNQIKYMSKKKKLVHRLNWSVPYPHYMKFTHWDISRLKKVEAITRSSTTNPSTAPMCYPEIKFLLFYIFKNLISISDLNLKIQSFNGWGVLEWEKNVIWILGNAAIFPLEFHVLRWWSWLTYKYSLLVTFYKDISVKTRKNFLHFDQIAAFV